MSIFSHKKYRPIERVSLPQRSWPDKVIEHAPQWCSVDLRDGNQALIDPMSVAQKKRLFDLLVGIGFKQIEVGFPAASQSDYDFVRLLIDDNQVPDNVTIQVLCQCREDLIKKTFAALQGAKNVIVHIYNSTSTVQREKVFCKSRNEIIDIAVNGAQLVQKYADQWPETNWAFEYSPESFTGTELDFAVQICDAVIDVWQPTVEKPVIINLPSTVEMATPNVYADQIEWFANQVSKRDAIIISLHSHNDRGCAVAASELGLMAGADRVEGTLLGNGERTGNMDIVTMAMNMYSVGINPELDFSNINEIINCYKEVTQLPVHPRHPYVGDLVFTAFSGSHQDAIKKCLSVNASKDDASKVNDPEEIWDVAYLPIDPTDLGRTYQEVIRINSQSGKGGVAYVLERDLGFKLPRWLQIEFSAQVQAKADASGTELAAEEVWHLFRETYLETSQDYELNRYTVTGDDSDQLVVDLKTPDGIRTLKGEGNGVLEAFTNALQDHFAVSLQIIDYSEHSMNSGTQAQAVTYISVKYDGQSYSGVAIDGDIVAGSMRAILKAVNMANKNAAVVAA